MNTQTESQSLPGADAAPKRGKIIGQEGRSISVRYGAGVTDILLIRPCDFHGVSPLEGAEVELRYTDHGNAGAWWHAYPAQTPDFFWLDPYGRAGNPAWYWRDDDCDEPMGPFDTEAEARDDYRNCRVIRALAKPSSSDAERNS